MHSIDFNDMTVYHIDENDEYHDLNAEGEPIPDLDTLRKFVNELYKQGAFPDETRRNFIMQIESERRVLRLLDA